MSLRILHWFEYAQGHLNVTRHHRHLTLQIGHRVWVLWHHIGGWQDAAFNPVEV